MIPVPPPELNPPQPIFRAAAAAARGEEAGQPGEQPPAEQPPMQQPPPPMREQPAPTVPPFPLEEGEITSESESGKGQ